MEPLKSTARRQQNSLPPYTLKFRRNQANTISTSAPSARKTEHARKNAESQHPQDRLSHGTEPMNMLTTKFKQDLATKQKRADSGSPTETMVMEARQQSVGTSIQILYHHMYSNPSSWSAKEYAEQPNSEKVF